MTTTCMGFVSHKPGGVKSGLRGEAKDSVTTHILQKQMEVCIIKLPFPHGAFLRYPPAR